MKLNEIDVEVTHKDIKNVHLSVYPPKGRVKVSAPESMSLDTIRVYVVSKLGWIRKQQQKLRAQEREAPRDYIERESHYVWGKRHLMEVEEQNSAPSVNLSHSKILLSIRPGSNKEKKRSVLENWYRRELKQAISPLVKKWQIRLNVQAKRVIVQKMKTKWGSCNPMTGIIRINLELAKKPLECLEYIVVHELTHLLEPTHNERFIASMNSNLPKWNSFREELNRLPVRHEDWDY